MRFHNDDSVRAAEAFRRDDRTAFYPAHIIHGEKISGSEALLAPQNVLS